MIYVKVAMGALVACDAWTGGRDGIGREPIPTRAVNDCESSRKGMTAGRVRFGEDGWEGLVGKKNVYIRSGSFFCGLGSRALGAARTVSMSEEEPRARRPRNQDAGAAGFEKIKWCCNWRHSLPRRQLSLMDVNQVAGTVQEVPMQSRGECKLFLGRRLGRTLTYREGGLSAG